jgi:hypothetical protein
MIDIKNACCNDEHDDDPYNRVAELGRKKGQVGRNKINKCSIGKDPGQQ